LARQDPYYSKFTIGLHEVFQAHFLLIDFFFDVGEGIGGVGPKNMNLLHSALSRQFAEYGGKPKWSDRIHICGSLMYGLIKNHPFHDANKRTASLTSILHLQKIGRTPVIAHNEFEDFTVDIAEDSLHRYEGYNEFVQYGSDADVMFIARYLKRATRQIDLRVKQITYNELNAIISKRNMYLDNPNGNRIDLIRKEVGFGPERHHRIAKIGFHGWSKEVSRRDIDIVR
jgi:death-on-curing protein